ncbi:SOS response-associated peptidase [Aeromonas rivipollensis]|jgi:putative SOS response-associated peptidase YedK|uniref:SOS response-associated peptidase n=1 Tax=Aeromonas rivipollensis TaxID=948519 RepID=UPI001F460E9F|nr:SOS response-associated peptidase family protein [Aeromonas rivipollensis]MCE9957648.1 SOS response-associated peptidase family protein [Aeromonas rivipollensis]
MCINYIPTTKAVLEEYFEVDDPGYDWEEEVWQDYLAPILILHDGKRQARIASYGLVPKRKVQPGGKHYATMNARAETVGEKPTYKRAWQQGHLCLVPMTGFFEPCYESGKAERWRINMADGSPFAVAGIWRAWQEEQGYTFSFSQLTINADTHPLLRRMHKPGDEKRSLVIVPKQDYDSWLGCRDPELARAYLIQQAGELLTGTPMSVSRWS